MNQYPSVQHKPKVRAWLWILLLVVIIGATGFFYWTFLMPSKTALKVSPSPQASDEISKLDTDLKSLDNNFDQLDKINPAEDTAPSL